VGRGAGLAVALDDEAQAQPDPAPAALGGPALLRPLDAHGGDGAGRRGRLRVGPDLVGRREEGEGG
jgi:hypothetical protein